MARSTRSASADLVRRKQVSARPNCSTRRSRARKGRWPDQRGRRRHYDYARQAIARALPDGPFRGVPFLLKDLNLLAGTRTTFGASICKGLCGRSRRDTVSRRFVDAGLASSSASRPRRGTLMPTTETRLFGPTRNPWNTGHSSGGSSGGAAAAVAGAHHAVAHANRRRRLDPHSGVRPLRRLRPQTDAGRTPTGPDRGEGWAGFPSAMSSRSACATTPPCWTRSRAGTRQSLSRAAARVPYLEEVSRAPGKLRIVFTDKPSGAAIDPEIAAAVRDVAKMLEKLGHHVEERAETARRTGDVMAKITRLQYGADGEAGRKPFRPHDDRPGFRAPDAGVRGAAGNRQARWTMSRRNSPPSAFRAHSTNSSTEHRRCLPVADALPAAAQARHNRHDGRSEERARRARRLHALAPPCSTCPASPPCRSRSPGTRLACRSA